MSLRAARPESVGVVGAGVVGLATAWHLQRRGMTVEVFDRTGVAGGSSWGNAGWLTPSLATPLPGPGMLQHGLRALLRPASPVFVPPPPSARTLRFLASFVRNCSKKRWSQAMEALAPINRVALNAFDVLADAGVAHWQAADSYIAGFRTESGRSGLVADLERAKALGQDIDLRSMTGDAARELEPALSADVGLAVEVRGERFVDPGALAEGLATAVIAGGGKILSGRTVSEVGVREGDPGLMVKGRGWHAYDAVVIATGAWLEDLVRPLGVGVSVQGGRGYSFSVTADEQLRRPVYLPEPRVVCTPLQGSVRVSGMMEIEHPDAAPSPRRLRAIVESVRPFLPGLHLASRAEEWVGARPCTADGLPVVGATAVPGVYINGGHGMWGVTHAPATADLLAEQIETGRRPQHLEPFSPLR